MRIILVTALIALSPSANALTYGNFTDLGSLGATSCSSPPIGTYCTHAYAVSGNGSVVVGYSYNASGVERAFRWANGSMQDLGTLDGTAVSATAKAVSSDGSVVVGASTTTTGYTAYRWQNGTMTSLGSLGGSSTANAVSSDGSVVVGKAYWADNYTYRAFRWTSGTGMVDLGTLGGTWSNAVAVSSDGTAIIGSANVVGDANYYAYRWTSGAGMVNLGNLGGSSSAYAVSSDGQVVAGRSFLAGGAYHAFRWTSAGGMSNLGTLGGTNSSATGMSTDGSVLVGTSDITAGGSHAFRWTSAGGMLDLGTLAGDTTSAPSALSSDGAVVIGTSSGTGSTAFRWSQASGIQSVASWVTGSGGSIPAGYSLLAATGISSDGTVVVGDGTNGGKPAAWLAKAGTTTGFLPDLTAFNSSLGSAGGSATLGALSISDLAVYGSHHRTLLDSGLPTSPNGNCGWSAVDAARNNGSSTNIQVYEAGLCADLNGFRLGVGLGQGASQQGLALGGSASMSGNYVLGEISRRFDGVGQGQLELSLLAFYGTFGSNINRAYASGAGVDVSSGSPTVHGGVIRARVDWLNALAAGGFSISPYGAWTVSRADVGAYTETGGAFPASYAAGSTTVSDVRIGFATNTKIGADTRLRLAVEGVHQFQSNTAGVSGNVPGLFGFNVAGQGLSQNWARVMVDLDHQFDARTVMSIGLNASTPGNEPSFGATIGLRTLF